MNQPPLLTFNYDRDTLFSGEMRGTSEVYPD